jgi:TonB-dependent SusC/RagA subfamily outer membrane receptor
LLGLTLPSVDEHWLAGFSSGLDALARRSGVALAGGDTTRGPLTATIALAGTVPAGHALRRYGAEPGDDLWISGTPGDAAAGLAILQGRLPGQGRARDALLHRFQLPEARVALGLALRGIATACIDVSDGLAGDPRDGRPGAPAALQIRNMGEPLYLIDNVPATADDFNNLNPADIETVSLLKDASAAVYGFRAANGVLLVQTKRGGRDAAPRVQISGYYGAQNPTRYHFQYLVNAYEYQHSVVDNQANLNSIAGNYSTITALDPAILEQWRIGAGPPTEFHGGSGIAAGCRLEMVESKFGQMFFDLVPVQFLQDHSSLAM